MRPVSQQYQTTYEKGSASQRAISVVVVAVLIFIPLFVGAQVSRGELASFVSADDEEPSTGINSQRLAVLDGMDIPSEPKENEQHVFAQIVNGHALDVEVDPLQATDGQEVAPERNEISTYVVQPGDTVSGIAEQFGVTSSTILWANDLSSRSTISIGQELVILPVTGIVHIVKKGETLSSIAKAYKGDVQEIKAFNVLDDNARIGIGDRLVIPNGEPQTTSTRPSSSSRSSSSASSAVVQNGYYTSPIIGIKSRGITGAHKGVDVAAPVGTPTWAMADGVVVIAKPSGYNGGYGKYVVIKHPNGSQTVYGHLSQVDVRVGQNVSQGQQIGLSGNTGRSTGPHLHYEVRINGGYIDPGLH